MNQTLHFNNDYHTLNNKKTNISFFCFINNPQQQKELRSKIKKNKSLLIYICPSLSKNTLKHSQNSQKIHNKLNDIFNEYTAKIITKKKKMPLTDTLKKSLHPLPAPYNYIAIMTVLLLSLSNKTVHLQTHTLSKHDINIIQLQEKFRSYTHKKKRKNKELITLLTQYTAPIETLTQHENNIEITSTMKLKRFQAFGLPILII